MAEMYDASYYGVSGGGEGHSGYGDYSRWSSHANTQAYLLWRFFPVDTSLDVGCARGYVVEALRERGVDASGVDISKWAVRNAAPGARGHVRVVDLERRAPSRLRRYELLSAFEVLEHVAPEQVPVVLKRMRSRCSGWVVATIPSIGVNENGYLTCLSGKVRPDRIPHYEQINTNVSGPIALADLEVDADGRPIHGHLTIASYQWWTEQFEAAGFERVPEMEARLNPVIARFGLAMAWNLYVFRVPGTATPSNRLWPRQFLAAVEHQWRLDELQPDVHSYNAVTLSRGTQGWKDVQTELSSSGTPDVAGRSAGSAA